MTGSWFISRVCCQSCFLLKYPFLKNATASTVNSRVFLSSRARGWAPTTHNVIFQSKYKMRTISESFCTISNEKDHEMSEESAALILEHKTIGKKSKKNLNDGVYILYPHIADYVSRHLIGTNDDNSSETDSKMIIEVNPGIGTVTKALLRDGVRNLRLCESNEDFVPLLEKLRDEHPMENVQIVKKNFFRLAKLAYVDKITFSDNIERLFEGVRTKSWVESPPLVVFGTVPQKYEAKFMRYLLINLAKQNGMFSYGRVQFVFFISGKEYECMTFEPKRTVGNYRMASVLYNVFFDIVLLAKENTKYFYPEPVKTRRTRLKYDQDHLYLVRLTPKSDLLSHLALDGQLLEFYYFVKQHMVKRKGIVIYSLEKWIPNCGPRLIKEGFTIFTRFGDLSPQQFLHLFIQFSSWPEYADSQFRSMFFKMDTIEDHADEDDEHDVEI